MKIYNFSPFLHLPKLLEQKFMRGFQKSYQNSHTPFKKITFNLSQQKITYNLNSVDHYYKNLTLQLRVKFINF